MKSAFWVLFVLLFATACKQEARGKVVEFKEVCSGKYWAKEQRGDFKGERIAFPGFFKFSTGLQTDTILLDLYENPEKTGKHITVSVRVHGGKNGIDPLPKEVKQSDIKIHANGGETLSVADRVIVHGEHIASAGDEQSCLFKAHILEKG